MTVLKISSTASLGSGPRLVAETARVSPVPAQRRPRPRPLSALTRPIRFTMSARLFSSAKMWSSIRIDLRPQFF
jgi:hypothetical protein